MNFLNRVRKGLFSSAEKIFADHRVLFDRWYVICWICRFYAECLIVYSLLNETMLKIFRDYRVSFNFEWISNDLWETCVCWIYVRELFFIFYFFLVNYYSQNNNFDDLDFFLILSIFCCKNLFISIREIFIVIILKYYKINVEINIVIHEIESFNYYNGKKFMKDKIFFICSS